MSKASRSVRALCFCVVGALALLVAGCGSDDEGGPGITGKVVDSVTGQPLGGAVFAIEKDGTYVKNDDTSKGNPSYTWGGRAAADGTFTIQLPPGVAGLHVFAEGHRYFPKTIQVQDDTALNEEAITPEPNLASDVPPALTDAAFEPSTVAPSGEVHLSVMAAAADPVEAPLSEEVLVVFPEATFSKALDPPSPGQQGFGYPDGLYQTTLTAPSTPGSYSYYLVVSAENCVIGPILTATLSVQ